MKLLTVIILVLLAWLFAGCANIPFERTYSIGYEGATASATFRPRDGKAVRR